MKRYAIWKNHKVIGYIELTEEQRQLLNGIPGIGVYFGFDKVTQPEKYVKKTLQRSTKKLHKQAKIKLTKHNL